MDKTDQDTNPPVCPLCGGLMALRISKKGPRPGTQFWGCAKYPECRGTKTL